MEEEYKMLREEIMLNINKMHWYVSIVSTVAVALLTYIIQNTENITLFSVFLATLVIIEGRIYSITKSSLRISTYMEVFLEPNLENRKWETYSYIKKKNTSSQPENTNPQTRDTDSQDENIDLHTRNENSQRKNLILKIKDFFKNKDSRLVKETGIISYISGINTACLLIGLIPFVLNCIALPDNLSLLNVLLTAINAAFILSLFIMSLVYIVDIDISKRDKYFEHWKYIRDNPNNTSGDGTDS